MKIIYFLMRNQEIKRYIKLQITLKVIKTVFRNKTLKFSSFV